MDAIRRDGIKIDFLDIVVKDASKPSVSWLNFEPKVSKFPVIESAFAGSVTIATMESLFFL